MNEKGVTFVEMLVALTIVLMVASVLIPGYVKVRTERRNLVLKQVGQVIMQEQMYAHYHDPSQKKDREEREGVVYDISHEKKKICVTWKNFSQQEEKICRNILE